jgi:hypothetical protein
MPSHNPKKEQGTLMMIPCLYLTNALVFLSASPSLLFFISMLLSIVIAYVALFSPILAFPAYIRDSHNSIFVPRPNPSKFLCGCGQFSPRLCPSQGDSLDILTPLGIAHGVADPDGALRFTVRYAQAARWQPSSVVTAWDLPYVHLHIERLD